MDLYISLVVSLLIAIVISYFTKNKGFHIDFISISFGLFLTLGSRLFVANETQEIDRSGFLFIAFILMAIMALSFFSVALWLSYGTKSRKSKRNKSLSGDFLWASLNYATSFLTAIFCLQLMFAVTINMSSLKITSEVKGELHYFVSQIYADSSPWKFFITITIMSLLFIMYRILTDRQYIINLKRNP